MGQRSSPGQDLDSRVAQSFGLAYQNDCFTLSALYSDTEDPYSDLASEKEIFVRFSLRTIADSSFSSQLDNSNTTDNDQQVE